MKGINVSRKNIAVILASGSGSRFGSNLPKQFIRLGGKPVIQYTIEAFEKAECIDDILIVTREDFVDYVLEIVNVQQFGKVGKVISGGKQRYDSTLAALNAIADDKANLIIHDAVRPFISQDIIRNCVTALDSASAVDVVVDATDTIVRVENEKVTDIPDRRFLRRGQTPQAFRKTVLEKAYDAFMQDDDKVASDDCGIVLKYLPDVPVATVQGNEANFKITHQQDIYLADNLLKDGVLSRMENKHPELTETFRDKVVVIIGGTSGIGKDLAELCNSAGASVHVFSRQRGGVDVTQIDTIYSALHTAHEQTGRIDYIINTAGLLVRKPLMTMTDAEVQESFNVNYTGVINTARAGFDYLQEAGGMLVNFTSSSYTRGRPNYSIYSSTKAAVVNFTQAIAEEWLPHGIKVNVINPQRTATPMRVANFGQEDPASLLDSREVAEFTLSAMSLGHSGQVYSINNDL